MPRTRSLASGADVPRSSISFAISGVARSFFLIASILLGPNPRRVYFPGVRPIDSRLHSFTPAVWQLRFEALLLAFVFGLLFSGTDLKFPLCFFASSDSRSFLLVCVS